MAKTNQKLSFSIFIFVLFAAFLIRFVHLEADTPKGVSDNIGLYVDEGYKTLGPRNLILFGDSTWHANDSYSGWFANSPLTQWSFYSGFKLWGVNIRSARLMSVIAFMAFLAVVYFYYRTPNGGYYGHMALLILGFQSTLFFYSRVALFEIYLAAILYPSIFVVDRVHPKNRILAILILSGAAIGAIKLVKLSALIYFLPCFLTIFLFWLLHRERKISTLTLGCLIAGLFSFLVLGIYLFYNDFQARFAFSTKTIIRNIANIELATHSFAFVMAGYLAALHLIIVNSKAIFYSFYRSSLIAIVIACPLLFSLFTYNPLRYYIPILPAYLLLLVEWLRLKSYQYQSPAELKLSAYPIVILLLFLSCITGANVLNALLKILSIQIGDSAGLSDPTMARLAFPASLIAAIGLIGLRKFFLSKSIMNSLIVASLALAIGLNTYRIIHFHMNPVYRSRQIQESIAGIVNPNDVVAGDWAPFFTTNTALRSLYMNDVFNQKSVETIKPDYILVSKNRNSRINLDRFQSMTGVHLDEPVYSNTYLGKHIDLIPIRYDTAADSRAISQQKD